MGPMKPGSAGCGFMAIWFAADGFCGFCRLVGPSPGLEPPPLPPAAQLATRGRLVRAAVGNFHMTLEEQFPVAGVGRLHAGQAGRHLAGLHAVDDLRRDEHDQLDLVGLMADRAKGHAQVGDFADPRQAVVAGLDGAAGSNRRWPASARPAVPRRSRPRGSSGRECRRSCWRRRAALTLARTSMCIRPLPSTMGTKSKRVPYSLKPTMVPLRALVTW